jgi:signal recognition particle subunit SRP54
VNQVLKQYSDMRRMMKMYGNTMRGKMRGLGKLRGMGGLGGLGGPGGPGGPGAAQ